MLRHTPRTFVGTVTVQVTAPDRVAALTAAISRLGGAVCVGDWHVTVTTDRPLDRTDVVGAIEAAGLTCLD